MSEYTEIIREWTQRTMMGRAAAIEEQIKLALQPRPRWLPEWVWRRVIGRLLVIEYHPMHFAEPSEEIPL